MNVFFLYATELLTLRHHNAGETMSESEEEPMGGSAHGSHVESESEEGFVESESEEGFEEAPTVGSEEGTGKKPNEASFCRSIVANDLTILPFYPLIRVFR
jgi:hypothetical protein